MAKRPAADAAPSLFSQIAPVVAEVTEFAQQLALVIREIKAKDLDPDEVIALVEEGLDVAQAIGVLIAGRTVLGGATQNARASSVQRLARWYRVHLRSMQPAPTDPSETTP